MRKKQTSPRHCQKKYRAYSPETLLNAYKAVRDQGLTVKRAALQFGVPVQTLRDRVKGYIDPVEFKATKETCFTSEEELTLVENIETMAELGYGYSNRQLQYTAGELAFDLGKKSSNKPLSNNWLYGFMKRWRSRLSSLKPSKLDSNRAKSTTPECVQKYYENLSDIFYKYDLHRKPQNIYNIDETGLQPDHRPPTIIAPTNSKPQAITSPRSTTTTLIGCANAAGNSVPPFFVFKGKRFNPDLMKGATIGTGYSMSDSGWSNAAIFRSYLEDHFLPNIRGQLSADNPVLVIYDGHASHVGEPLVKWARTQNIILFVLPAHTSHILQPLDVGIFGPLKTFYYTECAVYMNKHMGKNITRYEICQLACKAYLKSMTPINILSGFKKTGIFPLAPGEVPMEKLLPCESFRDDDPLQKAKAMKGGKEAVEEFFKQKYSNQTNERFEALKKEVHTRPKAGGRAITEDEFYTELVDYEKSKKSNNKEQSKTSKKGKNTCFEKIVDDSIVVDPVPSTSGVKNVVSCPMVVLSEDEDESEVNEKDLCCVCKQISPPKLKDLPFLKIVNWAQCDHCDHWVHLQLCTNVHVVRRHSTFLCPHCET